MQLLLQVFGHVVSIVTIIHTEIRHLQRWDRQFRGMRLRLVVFSLQIAAYEHTVLHVRTQADRVEATEADAYVVVGMLRGRGDGGQTLVDDVVPGGVVRVGLLLLAHFVHHLVELGGAHECHLNEHMNHNTHKKHTPRRIITNRKK
jgi:hypothetical protein